MERRNVDFFINRVGVKQYVRETTWTYEPIGKHIEFSEHCQEFGMPYAVAELDEHLQSFKDRCETKALKRKARAEGFTPRTLSEGEREEAELEYRKFRMEKLKKGKDSKAERIIDVPYDHSKVTPIYPEHEGTKFTLPINLMGGQGW